MAGPVELCIHARWKENRRHDIDSLYAKAIIDQMVVDKIIPDDNLNIVQRVSFTGETGQDTDEVCVLIKEV